MHLLQHRFSSDINFSLASIQITLTPRLRANISITTSPWFKPNKPSPTHTQVSHSPIARCQKNMDTPPQPNEAHNDF
jgi:hypothetical protein